LPFRALLHPVLERCQIRVLERREVAEFAVGGFWLATSRDFGERGDGVGDVVGRESVGDGAWPQRHR